MLLASRYRYRECAASANSTLQPHTTAMELHQFLNQRQSDPCTFVRPGARVLDAMKAFEHPFAVFFGNSHPRVAYLQLHNAVHCSQLDGNLAFKRELEGIGDQIYNDLLPHVTIHVHRLRDRLTSHSEP